MFETIVLKVKTGQMRPTDTADARLHAAQDQFILEWGRMSSSWGINRTMAQIHALLLATGQPHSVDEIIERLHISRGNASMNLRDLIDWGVIQRFRRPGDRKDIYVSDPDVWHMFARVIRERKRREIDPTIAAIRECLAMAPAEEQNTETEDFRERLSALLEVFDIVDRFYNLIFQSDEALRSVAATIREEVSANKLESGTPEG